MTYQEYLQSDHWQAKRKEALEFHGAICQCCQGVDNLEVHHEHYKTVGNEDVENDLAILCKRCHFMEHWLLSIIIKPTPRTEFTLTEYMFMGFTQAWNHE